MSLVARKYSFLTLFLNIVFGGMAYVLVNYLSIDVPLNFFSGLIITLLGVPGVSLLVLIKYIFLLF